MNCFKRSFLVLILIALLLPGCESANTTVNPITSNPWTAYNTKNVIIVVIDGPRFKETWGDPLKIHIPRLANELAPEGINHNRFYNRGATYTTSGLVAITTGTYQWMANDGSEIPFYPSIFQAWLEKSRDNPNKALIVTSKQKLAVLGDCVLPQWRGKFNPMVDAVDRDDKETLVVALQTMKRHHPRMALIHFRGPDMYGHANDWANYIKSINETDQYTYDIWKFLQNDSIYQDVTTLIVTNDHGRHNDGVRDGFINHGDFCEGCMHINLYITGPDFQSNLIADQPREVVDIAPTVAELMGFQYGTSASTVMWELFRNEP